MKIGINERVMVLDVNRWEDATMSDVYKAQAQGLRFFVTWGKYLLSTITKQYSLDWDKVILTPMLLRMKQFMTTHILPISKFEISDAEYEALKDVIEQQPKVVQKRFDDMIAQNNIVDSIDSFGDDAERILELKNQLESETYE